MIEKDPDGTRGKEAMDMEECNDKNPHTFRVLKGKHVNEMKTKLISNPSHMFQSLIDLPNYLNHHKNERTDV